MDKVTTKNLRRDAVCPFCGKLYTITRRMFPQHGIDFGMGATVDCEGSGLTPSEARREWLAQEQEGELNAILNEATMTTEQQALTRLFDIELFEGDMTVNEHNDMVRTRQAALKMLTESANPLLNEVAAAAMKPMWWKRNKKLLVRIGDWLGCTSPKSTSVIPQS